MKLLFILVSAVLCEYFQQCRYYEKHCKQYTYY